MKIIRFSLKIFKGTIIFFKACQKNFENPAIKLISNRADVNLATHDGSTSLMFGKRFSY